MCACKISERGGAKAAFFTLGCRVNQYETRAMEEAFEKKGFELVEFDAEDSQKLADVYVINTCTVTAESDRKCRNMIRRACENAAKTCGIVIVAGCYAQKDAGKIAAIDGVSLIIGNEGKSTLADTATELLEKRRQAAFAPISRVTDISEVTCCEEMSITASDRTRAFVKIVDGCDNKCTYCIIPSVRGHVRSRNQEEIIKEIEGLASVGYKEIVLTGIETAAYGTDFESARGDALISLVKRISEIDGIERIRFGSLEPTLFTEDFVTKLADFKKVMPHFHISLQSGSSKVLALMKRKYNADMFRKKVMLLRRHFPALTLTTDIIVGFPGENNADFEDTAEFVRECEFAYVHIFPYSKREGTPAANMREQLTSADKKERAAKLHDVMMSIRRKVLSENIGKIAEILIETNDGKNAFGHSENFIEYELDYQSGKTEENALVRVETIGIADDGMRLIGKVL